MLYSKFAYGEFDRSFGWPTVEAYLDTFTGRTPANVFLQVPPLRHSPQCRGLGSAASQR